MSEIEITWNMMIWSLRDVLGYKVELIYEKKVRCDLPTRWGYSSALVSSENQYQLLVQVVIPTIVSNGKSNQSQQNTTLNTTPITPPNTPSKPIIHNMLIERLLSDTEKANDKTVWKYVISIQISWWNRWESIPYSWI